MSTSTAAAHPLIPSVAKSKAKQSREVVVSGPLALVLEALLTVLGVLASPLLLLAPLVALLLGGYHTACSAVRTWAAR
jgi:hypothetical protein